MTLSGGRMNVPVWLPSDLLRHPTDFINRRHRRDQFFVDDHLFSSSPLPLFSLTIIITAGTSSR